MERAHIRFSVCTLALPIVWSNLLGRGVGIVDTVMVGHVGAAELAAVGLSQLVMFVMLAIVNGVATGAMVRVAYAKGAGDREAQARGALTGIILGGCGGGVVSVIGVLFGYELCRLMGAPEEIAGIAQTYIAILSWFFIPKALFQVISQLFQGVGDSRTPLRIIFAVNIIHVVIAYGFIYGVSLSGVTVPALGVAGAAIATVISEMLGLAVLIRLAVRTKLLTFDRELFTVDEVRSIVVLGLPVFFERIVVTFMQMVYTRMVIGYSVAAYAAHQIGVNLEALSFLPGMGFAQATTALVSQRLGAKRVDDAREIGYQATFVTFIFMSTFGVLFLAFPRFWMGLFTSDLAVIEFGVVYCGITAFCQPLIGTGLVLAGALRGAGQTRSVFYANMVGAWLVRLPVAYCAGPLLGLPISAVWGAMFLDWVIRVLILVTYFRHSSVFKIESKPVEGNIAQ